MRGRVRVRVRVGFKRVSDRSASERLAFRGVIAKIRYGRWVGRWV